jgi:hypothetical protein
MSRTAGAGALLVSPPAPASAPLPAPQGLPAHQMPYLGRGWVIGVPFSLPPPCQFAQRPVVVSVGS